MTEKADLLSWLDRGCTVYSIGSVLFPIAAPHFAILSEPLVLTIWSILLFFSAYYLGRRGSERKLAANIEEMQKLIDDKDTQIAELDSSISDLKGDLLIARQNAEATLMENGESWEHVKTCQKVLDVLVSVNGDPDRVKKYIDEELGKGVEHAMMFSRAYNDLIKYKCIRAHDLVEKQGGGYDLRYPNAQVVVLENAFPSLVKRRSMDVVRDTEEAQRKAAQKHCSLAGAR